MIAGQQETVIYQDQLVTITTARAVMGGTTYAMANITSVRHTTESGKFGCLLLIALCAVIGWIIEAGKGGSSYVWFMLAAIGFGVAAYFARRAKHWVTIGTAGAEHKAIFSYKQRWTTDVVAALNNAIIARG